MLLTLQLHDHAARGVVPAGEQKAQLDNRYDDLIHKEVRDLGVKEALLRKEQSTRCR